MICSFNEIEAMARKAARGGGLSWGLAEEAGKAVRRLAEAGLPGPQLLADLLRRNDGRQYSDLMPMEVDGVLTAKAGRLCPIIAGAYICDCADALQGGNEIRLGETASPALLLPFIAAAARRTGITAKVVWPGAQVWAGGGQLLAEGANETLLAAETAAVSIVRGGPVTGRNISLGEGRDVSDDTWRALEEFAYRTYAPATEASRAGAGAGSERD